jgi:chemotaxis protein MotA
MDVELETHHHETAEPGHVMHKMADGLPAFGIVVAVMGVVNVMSSVGEPPAVLGRMIGGALVGTFLGILVAYGFIGPIATAMEHRASEEGKAFEIVKMALVASVRGYAPPVAVEFARKLLFAEDRPTFGELEAQLKDRRAPGAAGKPKVA